jgi:hypothetical protein
LRLDCSAVWCSQLTYITALRNNEAAVKWSEAKINLLVKEATWYCFPICFFFITVYHVLKPKLFVNQLYFTYTSRISHNAQIIKLCHSSQPKWIIFEYNIFHLKVLLNLNLTFPHDKIIWHTCLWMVVFIAPVYIIHACHE